MFHLGFLASQFFCLPQAEHVLITVVIAVGVSALLHPVVGQSNVVVSVGKARPEFCHPHVGIKGFGIIAEFIVNQSEVEMKFRGLGIHGDRFTVVPDGVLVIPMEVGRVSILEIT